jgi:succinate dehydrogenase / fumarate reductase, iron-sulfur subunit
MKINIQRDKELVGFEVFLKDATLLEMLNFIKSDLDSSLAFSAGCRSGVCGSCAVRVNGKEVLACTYKPSENDTVEPMKNVPLLRDLAVDMEQAYLFNKLAKAWGIMTEDISVSPQDAEANRVQSDCILCGACYSACPVYAVNGEFLGPFALTRAYKYVADVRQKDLSGVIEAVQKNGIYDCTLCNECVPVCPQGIAPKQDIVMLRNKSGMMGYMDPNFAVGGFGDGLNF